MKKLLAALAFLLSCTVAAQNFTPVEGHYWSEKEPGTGYDVQVMNGTMVVAIYSYTTAGRAQWYLVVCDLDGDTCSGLLQKYRDGQSIGGSYVAPQLDGNDGTATFTWLDEAAIEVKLPQGRVTVIRPFEFKRYAAASALLGKWVFIAFDVVGNTKSTPVLDFNQINDENDTILAPDQRAECRSLPAGVYRCTIVDLDKQVDAIWIVRLFANQARGASGNVLDGDVIVQGYRLDPATVPVYVEPK